MKSRKFKVGIVVAVVVVLAIGAVAGAKVIDIAKKAMMSPAEYYQHVETESRDTSEKMLLSYYDVMRESYSGDAKNIKMKMELSESAKAMLSLTGIDFSGLKSLELDAAMGREGKAYSNLIKVRGNDSDLLTIKTYVDMDGEEAYYQVPELSKSYLDISSAYFNRNSEDGDASEDGDESGKEDSSDDDSEGSDSGGYVVAGPGANAFMSLADLDRILIETDDLKEIYERYTDILIKSAKNVKKADGDSSGGITAEGVTQKADKYIVTLEGGEVSGLAKELLETVKGDDTVRGIIENSGGEEGYSEYMDSVDRSLERLNAGEADGMSAAMEVYIGSNDKIAGRTITLSGADDSEDIVINIHYPMDGEKFGCVFRIAVGDVEYVNLHGKGTLKNGVMDGEFTLGVDESLNTTGRTLASMDKLLVITVEDYDLKKLDKGEASGTFTYSTEAVAALAMYSLRVESEGSMKDARGKMTVLAGSEPFAEINVAMDSSGKPENVKPSESDTIYKVHDSAAMLAYQEEMDLVEFLGDLQGKLDIDLSGLIAGILGGM